MTDVDVIGATFDIFRFITIVHLFGDIKRYFKLAIFIEPDTVPHNFINVDIAVNVVNSAGLLTGEVNNGIFVGSGGALVEILASHGNLSANTAFFRIDFDR